MKELCNAVNLDSGSLCFEEAEDHPPMHKAWAHYPGQLVVWPYSRDTNTGYNETHHPSPGEPMTVFRMREYKTNDANPNVPDHKLEMTTEHRASSFAHTDTEWIYFYAELSV